MHIHFQASVMLTHHRQHLSLQVDVMLTHHRHHLSLQLSVMLTHHRQHLSLQVDVIESQYGLLLDTINSTRDFEAIKLAHEHFLAALLAQSFVHMKSVSAVVCLHEVRMFRCPTVYTMYVW